MSKKDVVFVGNEKGLYDEKVKPLVLDINIRKRCFIGHDWINAYLAWRRPTATGEWFIDLSQYRQRSEKEYHDLRLMRFCRRCKIIDCVHGIPETTSYAIRQGRFQYTEIEVGKCVRCRRRLCLGSTICHRPSDAALTLLHRELPDLASGHYGSMWMCEMPTEISEILEDEGEAAAIAHIRQCKNQNRYTPRGITP